LYISQIYEVKNQPLESHVVSVFGVPHTMCEDLESLGKLLDFSLAVDREIFKLVSEGKLSFMKVDLNVES